MELGPCDKRAGEAHYEIQMPGLVSNLLLHALRSVIAVSAEHLG